MVETMERNRDGNDAHRRARRSTPLGALVRGFAGGVACFDTVQFLPYRLGGGDARAVDWELSRGLTWADAPAPAQVGRRDVEGNFRIELPDRRASLAYNLVHWGYGIAWGGLFGLVAGSIAKLRLRHGLVFGTLVWLTGYVILPLAKLYRPL